MPTPITHKMDRRRPRHMAVAFAGFALVGALASRAGAQTRRPLRNVHVRNAHYFAKALAGVRPGQRLLLAGGVYAGGHFSARCRGTADRPIVITAADPDNPPIFRGGKECLHLARPAHLRLEHLVFESAEHNGLNIDDGGARTDPAHDVVLDRLLVRNVGSGGNHDGIKLSGLTRFRLLQCRVEGWGSKGSAVDMVGCHDGLIAGCLFRQTPGRGGTGVQVKGGSSRIRIERNRLEQAGERALNLGGCTGLEYFRPPLAGPGPHAEARDLFVTGNVIIGGEAAIAFVGLDGATVTCNTIYRPKRWVLRILQENRTEGFVPSRNGLFRRNLIAFRSNELKTTVNVGPATAPGTFPFVKNFWYCLDRPPASRPSLPTPEVGGVYGQDPLFRDAGAGDLSPEPDSPARSYGADAAQDPERETGGSGNEE